MALDPEELKRRRQERQRRRQQQQRKMLIHVGVGVVALVILILVILLISRGCSKKNTPTEATESTAETTDNITAESTQPTESGDTVIHLAAAGDLNITDRVVAAGGENLDYTRAFLDVAHLFGNADISVLNFEGNLVGTPYGTKYVSAPQSMMDALDTAGVDLIQLGNSYSVYNGILGLSDTIDAVRTAGMEPVGAFADEETYEKSEGFTICNVQGIKIAFVTFTKGVAGMTIPTGSEKCVNILYKDYDGKYQEVDTVKIDMVMTAVKKQKPDLVVALVHWGSEYDDIVSGSQQKICEQLQKHGADAIIGTHSHFLQQMTYDEKTGNFVAYSLGDFFGEGKRPDETKARLDAKYSVVLDLEITKNADGKTKITGYSYTPIYTVLDEDTMRVVRVAQTIAAYEAGYIDRVSQATYEELKQVQAKVEKRIKPE